MYGSVITNCTCLYMVVFYSALERADAISRQADIVAALTLEVLKGTSKAFESGKHQVCFICYQSKEISGFFKSQSSILHDGIKP